MTRLTDQKCIAVRLRRKEIRLMLSKILIILLSDTYILYLLNLGLPLSRNKEQEISNMLLNLKLVKLKLP